MTSLKKRMSEELVLRGLSEATHTSYLYAVKRLAQYSKKPIDRLSHEEVRGFVLFLLQEKNLSASSVRGMINGIFFFYYKVLKWPKFSLDIPLPKLERRQPEILNPLEVFQIIHNTRNLKEKTALMTAYSTGLRVGELVALRVSDIDSDRMVVRVEQGKGKKDRYTILTPTLFVQLREFYRRYRPGIYLCGCKASGGPLSKSAASRYFRCSCIKSNITKHVSFHTLRHSFATHQIINGMHVTELQKILGHNDLRTTMRYVHLAQMPTGKDDTSRDLLNMLNQLQEL